MSHRIRFAALLAALALSTASLAACSAIPNPEELVDGGSDGGSDAAPFAEIPASFPAEVPLVDGEVFVALQPTDTSWGVTLYVPDEAAAAQSAVLLEDAGFTEQIEGTHAYENDSYNVVLQWGANDDGGYAVVYAVSAK